MKNSKKNRSFFRSWKLNSLFVRTLAMVCLLVMVPLLGIVAISTFSANADREREMRQVCADVAEDISLKWTRLLEEYNQILSFVSYDEEVVLFFYDTEQDQKFYSKASLEKTVRIPVLAHRYASNAFIFSDDVDQMVTTKGISRRQYNVEREMLEEVSALVKDKVRVSTNVDNTGNKFLLFHDGFTVGKVTGIFMLKCNVYQLLNHFNFQEEGDFFITDDKQVLLSNRSELIGTEKTVLEQYGSNYIRESVVPEYSSGLTLTIFLDESRIQTSQSMFRGTMLLFIVALFCVTLALAFWISNKLYTPFREILALLQENGEFSEENAFGSRDELEYIIGAINQKRYFDEDAGQEMAKRLELLKKAQSVALQAQINPHFINNTLETISFMAIAQLGRENEVSRMVKALANMLRSTLGSVEALVPVSEEIRHCEQYLSIQNIRYQGKFQTFWDVDPEVQSCHIIRITLQPIVENAIYHGIKHLSKPGRLDISIRKEGEFLRICVRDNGLGMTEEKVKEVTQQMQEDMFQQSRHIGLANVYQRLKLFYGEDCSITVCSTLGEGTEITLTAPIK